MSALPPFIARYEIKQRLGQGGMGAIYLARDPVIDRLVALKLLHNDVASEDIRNRFAQEARASGALTHPNIVTIHDYGEFGDSPFIVMEYIRGETLAEIVRRGAEIPIAQKLRWVEQVCNALGYAHGENVVHRDVKPSNLMIDQHGVIKVLDFGIARILGAGLTKMSMVIGTPGYMSPEQIQGGAIDARSDIFAVGAVLYELLCYREAFAGESPHAVMSKVVGADPIPLRQFLTGADLSIADVVDRALQKKPEARYSSMTALEVAIRMARLALESQKTEVTILPHGRHPSPVSRRRRTDPVEIARRRAEQIEQHLKNARRARDQGDADAAATECEAVLLLDPASPAALALLDALKPDTPTELADVLRDARDAMHSGDFDTVERLLGRAAALEPKATEIQHLRGELHDRRIAQARPRQAVHDASLTVPAQPSHDATIDRLRPWEEVTERMSPPPDRAPAVPRRGALVWVTSILAVAVLAIGGWALGVRSTQSFGSPTAGAEPARAQPVRPAEPSARAPSTARPPVDVAATGAQGSPEPVERSADTTSPTQPSAVDATPRPAPSAERPSAADATVRLPMPPAPRIVDPGPALRLAEAAESRGDLNQALAHYREALRLDPANAAATRQIARIRAGYLVKRAEGLLEAGDYDAAMRDASAATDADPGNQSATELLKRIETARAADVRRRPPGQRNE